MAITQNLMQNILGPVVGAILTLGILFGNRFVIFLCSILLGFIFGAVLGQDVLKWYYNLITGG